jgi:prepilin-type N-terminal cleavage/methylation domain-containing protein
MQTIDPRRAGNRVPAAAPTCRRAFTLVELLVVIGIIALLIGLLFPALGKVIQRAKSTQTMGTMQNFAKACDSYFQEFGEYPAAIPDEVLYANLTGDGVSRITAAENALLALMGGYRIGTDSDYATYGAGSNPPAIEIIFPNSDFRIKIDQTKMGEGPVRNGKKYDTFFAPKGREFGRVAGQLDPATNAPEIAGAAALPDLVDAWGAPIAFIKQQRGIGPLVKRTTGNQLPRFERFGMNAYARTTALGDTGVDQTDTLKGSVLNTNTAGGQSGIPARDLTLGQLIRHPGLNTQSTSGSTALNDAEKVYSGTPKGKYFLFSAGPDGIYFSKSQLGMATPNAEPDIVGSMATQNPDGPRVIEKFDDVVVSGGS